MTVSDNGRHEGIGIEVGGENVASASGDEWSGRSLVTVGDDEYGQIPPGTTAVEVDVSTDASWSLKFVDPPAPSSPDEAISGQGQDVKFVDLTEGDWVVEITVSDNDDSFFDVDIGGRSVVFEFVESWTGKQLISVGDSSGQIPPGNAAIEVKAAVDASWMLMFMGGSATVPMATSTQTSTSTGTSEPSIELTGSGTDVRFVDLTEGQWVVEMTVSDNGRHEGIGIEVGDETVASASGDEWSGRSLVTVGDDEYGQIPPGTTAVEVDVSTDASWSLKFVDPPAPSSPDEAISGQGQDVKFVDLTEGDWVVEITVSDNDDSFFDVDIGGRSVVFEFVESWTGKQLISVGDSPGQVPPGNAAIEVKAAVDASWMLQFARADTLQVSSSQETVSGSGTDVRFVDLTEGQWVVEMTVSDNGRHEGIGIEVGDETVASASGDEWSGRSLVTVGDDEYGQIPPGTTAVEVDVSTDASWSLKFVDPPAPSSPDEAISGQGQDVKFVDLTEGDWVVEITVSDNDDSFFDVDIGGRSVVFEFVESWTGKQLISVGDSSGQIPPGNAAIEVKAAVDASWMLMFMGP